MPALSFDPVVQAAPGALAMPATEQSFEGLSNADQAAASGFVVLPPDPNGDIGPDHYVQWVNLAFAVWTRGGERVYGPAAGNTLWQGFGGPCERQNDGDPIVLYDHLANRWVMSQLAAPNLSDPVNPGGPFYQCIAVSATPDPTGAWYRYQFKISDSKLNDYPKLGVWPDGYYLAVNQFEVICISFFGCFFDWGGQGVAAFERDRMLAGQPARMVFFELPTSNLGGMLPADLDGPPPPAGTPAPFAQVDDDAWLTPGDPWGPVQDRLQLWAFWVDWADPARSRFTQQAVLATAPFDSDLCGYFDCIPQPGAPELSALSDRLMHRLQYRWFGTHGTLVLNHTVDVDGRDHAGIRWYELRDPGSGWVIYQQGTYAPDAHYRWMGSAAMDASGNLALGYSVSGSTLFPSIRYAGRLATDPPGTLGQAEAELMAGGGSQTYQPDGRWGDYSMLAVDPVDGCTFWYTQEYYATTSQYGWQTRIGSFRFPSCPASGDSPPTVSLTSPSGGATVAGAVPVTATASDDRGVAQVTFLVDGTAIGTDTDGNDGWSVTWNTLTATNGSHTLTAVATDTVGQTASHAITVTVANPSPTGMGVFRMDWTSGKNLTVTIHIRRDSDASGALAGSDSPVAGAGVSWVLRRDSNDDGSFSCGADRCWTFSGSTDKNGKISGKLIGAPAGRYQAEVTALTHGTYTWVRGLDRENPETFIK